QGPKSWPTSIVSYDRSAIVTAMIAGDASGCHAPDARAVSRRSQLRSRIRLRTAPAGTQMRVAGLAAAVVAAFVGVMYLRFASDSVHRPDPTPSPPSAPLSIAERCASYSRYPKPPQCGTPAGPVWWGVPTVPPTPVRPPNAIG